MRWNELRAGDVLIDTDIVGNDHILVRRDGLVGVWLRVESGTVDEDPECTFDDKPMEKGWDVYRGGSIVCST